MHTRQSWRPILVRQHVAGLLFAEQDLVDRVSSVLERDVLAIDVRGKEDFYRRVSLLLLL
jgi:hypothetical protein